MIFNKAFKKQQFKDQFFYSESVLNCGFEVLRLGRVSACHVSGE